MRILKDILKELEEDGFFGVDTKVADGNQQAPSDDPPLDYVFRKGVDVNQQAADGDAPLHYACRNSSIEDVEILISNGADINLPGDIGNTPLHEASTRGRLAVVKRLLESGADPRIKNEDSRTALDQAQDVLNTATTEEKWSEVSGLKKIIEILKNWKHDNPSV